MKKISILFLASVMTFGTSSCVVWKKKFDAEVAAKEKLAGEKKKLEGEKRELISQVNQLKSDTTSMGKKYRDLYAQYQELLKNSKMTKEQMSQALKDKEKLLADRESALAEKEKMIKELQEAMAKKDAAVKELLDKVKGALAGFSSDELTVEMKNGKVYVSLSEKLLFQSGKADVDKKGKEAIGKLADVLNKNENIDIQIEGHTDNVPIKTAVYKDNWDLSAARAIAIVRILTVDYKVTPLRVTPAGKSEYFPVVENDTPSNKAKNRRIEIVLSPKLDELFRILNG